MNFALLGAPLLLEHDLLREIFTTRFADLYWWFGLIIILIIGGYTFAAGGYLYTFCISKRLALLQNNHLKHIHEAIKRLNKKLGITDDELGITDDE